MAFMSVYRQIFIHFSLLYSQLPVIAILTCPMLTTEIINNTTYHLD